MSLFCLLGRHNVAAHPVPNQGFEFGTCRCCDRGMIRSGRIWRMVPKDFQVVWKCSHAGTSAKDAVPFEAPVAAEAALFPKVTRRGRIRETAELGGLGVRLLGQCLVEWLRGRMKTWSTPAPASRPVLALPAP